MLTITTAGSIRMGTMIHLLITLVSLVGTVVAATVPTAQALTGAPLAKAIDAVVLVTAYDGNREPISQGSGFIVTKNGRVATNQHVIDGAASVVVKFSSGAFYDVHDNVLIDCNTDLAILQLEYSGPPLPYLRTASADNIQVGDSVLAIGSPLANEVRGLSTEGTVSDGIVSGIRQWNDRNISLLQTTAPVSRGSSGGPLLNRHGNVVGVVTFGILTGQNLNFAVPIAYVNSLLDQDNAVPLDQAKCEQPEQQQDQSLATIAGIYMGRWVSNRFDASGYAVVTVTTNGNRVLATAKLTGSPIGYKGDELVGISQEFGGGAWTINFKARNSKLKVAAIFHEGTLVGDYRFRYFLLFDRGQWVLKK